MSLDPGLATVARLQVQERSIGHPTLEVGHMAFPPDVLHALTDSPQESVVIAPSSNCLPSATIMIPRSFEVAKRVADR